MSQGLKDTASSVITTWYVKIIYTLPQVKSITNLEMDIAETAVLWTHISGPPAPRSWLVNKIPSQIG